MEDVIECELCKTQMEEDEDNCEELIFKCPNCGNVTHE